MVLYCLHQNQSFIETTKRKIVRKLLKRNATAKRGILERPNSNVKWRDRWKALLKNERCR